MKILFSFVSLFLVTAVAAQERFHAYKSDWTVTANLKEAKYFQHVVKEKDGSWTSRYYYFNGPMIRMETYVDEKLTISKGRFCWYNISGKLDSTGIVIDGKKDSYWRYYTHPDSANATVYEKYDKGTFIWRKNYITKETAFSDGSIKRFDTTTVNDSTVVFTTVQVEASFPAGINGWKRYLVRNLKTPGRFVQIVNGNGKGTVVVGFMVDTEGNVSDVYPYKSAEWSIDTEAQRVIKKGPKWVPALQNGQAVNYWQRQSITFLVDEE
jgi:hypothetical protein